MAVTPDVADAAGLPRSTQVVVAGGGPVGLAAAAELGRRGITCLVAEPRPEVSHARPRCKTVNARTMEHLRRWGIAERFRARAPLPVSWSQDIVFCTSLSGHELSRFTGVLGLTPEGDRFPEPGQQAPQYVLEELLREVVTELPACTLATGTRVTAARQSQAAVEVDITDAAGEKTTVEAEYLVGCDGPRSTVRDLIGACYVGDHALRPNFGMVFRSDSLWQRVRHGPAVQYWTVNQTTPALMGPIDLHGTWWIIAFGVEADDGRRTARTLIEGAVGEPIDARIMSDDPWTARMQLASSLRSGRIFLAGDAAHLNPPFGGHGLNTGIGDAVDLGWKIAAMLGGWGGRALLDSYELERRPVQDRIIREARENMRTLSTDLVAPHLDEDTTEGEQARRRADAVIQESKAAEFHALDLVLDVSYEQSPLIAHERSSRPGAHPGARLPHAWLGDNRSLYDALGTGMTLIVLDAANSAWQPMLTAASACHVPLDIVDLRHLNLQDRYNAGLILVRPDQHVAWRGDRPPESPARIIDTARGATS